MDAKDNRPPCGIRKALPAENREIWGTIARVVGAVPEPGTWGMLLGGLAVLVGLQHSRRRALKGSME